VKSRAQLEATDLAISSPREAKIGKNADIILSGDLTIESTSTASKSHALVAEGARVTVAGNAEIVSGNKATLGKKTTVVVTQNLSMEAVKCTVKKSASVTAGIDIRELPVERLRLQPTSSRKESLADWEVSYRINLRSSANILAFSPRPGFNQRRPYSVYTRET